MSVKVSIHRGTVVDGKRVGPKVSKDGKVTPVTMTVSEAVARQLMGSKKATKVESAKKAD